MNSTNFVLNDLVIAQGVTTLARPKKDTRVEATTDRILSAAEQLFATQGFTNTSLREVAEVAGIKAPSLLYHFKTKDQLYDEVIRRAYQEVEQLLDSRTENIDKEGQWLQAFFSDLIALEESHHELFQVLNEGLVSPAHQGTEIIRECFIPLLDKFEALFRQSSIPRIPKKAPVRQAILQIIMAHSVRRSLGDVGVELCGAEDKSIELAFKLMDMVRHWK